MTHDIQVTDDIDACRALRRTVFINEQGVSEADEMDDLDGEAIHLLARIDGRAVGTARMLRKGDVAKIGRVCVLKEARGTGLGATLIVACMDHARAEGSFTTAYLSAQTHALPFYEKLGFVAYGPIYDDAGIPHRDMNRPL